MIAGAVLGINALPLAGKAGAVVPTALEVDSGTLVPEYFGKVEAVPGSQLLKAGFAERDITPDIGMQMAGDYIPTFVQGFHDRCKVRASVFDDGEKIVALVGVDTLVVPESVVASAREKIRALCGIPAGSVMIGAAHNHSSGPVGIVQPGEYDKAPEFVRNLAYKESSLADNGYFEQIARQIAGAVCQAYEERVEAWCGSATGLEDKVGFPRQFHMKNGMIYSHPGQGNPDILKPAGPVDREVGVIGAWDKQGRLLGCVVNYTCHATTNPGNEFEASANWIYYMERVIRGSMGAEIPVVFLQGAAGNVTQVDNMSPYKFPRNTEWAEFVGGRVGAEVTKTLLTMVPGRLGPIDARSTVLHIKRRVPSQQHVKEAYDIVKQGADPKDRRKWIFAKETILLDSKIKVEPIASVEIQVIQIGPTVFVSNPAELFCQAGLEIKANSQFPHTCVVSYANGAVGYVPSEDVLGPYGGGYESQMTSYSNLEVTASSQIVKAGLDLVVQLHPGAVPTPERQSAFVTTPSGAIGPNPWSYGDVPPEVD